MPDFHILESEISWKAVRSSGPGGQHVNKTSSKIVLTFNLTGSSGLTQTEKELLNTKLANRLTNAGELILESSETRSQHKNKELAFTRFKLLISSSLKKPKLRRKTKPTKASKFKRLRAKKITSEKKSNRQKPDL
tara:strand:+ start:177337 stop:177741 length:405 start_codon:yes stop_codon:yes gene_type:complete